MHMADALITPPVAGAMWAVSAAAIAFSSRKVHNDLDERRVPLMGVLGAFIFAAQMINFTIPGTGSSGHLGGGVLLAVLLGPHAAFLTISSVLFVQALFFADGGLLALGCNIFNIGFLPAFVCYPLLYRPLAGSAGSTGRRGAAAVVTAVAALQAGALGVVLQTTISGVAQLPFSIFIWLMLPIHLAIGLVEGLVTAALLTFISKARPDILDAASQPGMAARRAAGPVLITFLLAAAVTGGILSWFASEKPDGLEWSIAQASGQEELPLPEGNMHRLMAKVQEGVALLPDYSFRTVAGEGNGEAGRAGTTVAGLVGGVVTLMVAFFAGLLLKWGSRYARSGRTPLERREAPPEA